MRRNVLNALGATGYGLIVAAITAAIGWALWRFVWLPDPELIVLSWGQTELKLLEPRAFWLALIAPVVLIAQYFALTDFSAFQKFVNVVLRLALLAALIAALARPSVSRFDSRLCTVYAIDVSASVPDSFVQSAREVVAQGLRTRGTNLVRLVTFAGRPSIVDMPTGTTEVPALERPTDPADLLASDPSAALRVAYGLCPNDHIRRVVLITDGNENRGDIVAEAAIAADFGVQVYAHEIAFEPEPEVLVRNVEMPDDIELSEPFRMTAEVYANRDVTATWSLTQNEFRDVRGRSVELTRGLNRIEIEAEVYEPGFRRFVFEITPEGADRFEENNTFMRTVTVEGRPRVLYVEGESRARSYLERALDRERNDLANFDLEVRGAHGFPSSVEEMQGYDLIILSDVEASYISRSAMGAVERYVRDYGGGFLMVGGQDSFGPGGYDGTPFEEISPVTFDMQRQRDLPALALLLVIDRSGSMDGVKLEMAKDAARAVVDMLGPQDSVGVVAFDDYAETVVRIQSASNRSRIRSDIGRIGTGGGTNILPALQEAYIQLLETPARLKHVILLTDGQAPWDGIADVATAMRADDMTVSTVAVGREADRALLEMIAEIGGGRFYATDDPSNVPQIFVQETSQVARTNLVEEPFRAQVSGRSQALRGIDWGSSPYLLGYVQTQPKRGADVLLETEQGDPLFARWRVGLGRVAVFTSDIKNRWAVEWVRTRLYPQFWAQVARDMMRVDTEDVLAMDSRVEEGRARIVVDAIDENDRFINGLSSTVEVTDPEGSDFDVELVQTAAGRYEADFELGAYGAYLLEADHELEGNSIAMSFGALTHPYPDEYQTWEARPELARRVAALTGGSINPSTAELWDSAGRQTEFRDELWPWALFAALGLFVLDLLFRRVRMFGRKPVAWSTVAGKG